MLATQDIVFLSPQKCVLAQQFPREEHKFKIRKHVIPNMAKHKQAIEQHIKRLRRVGMEQLKVVNEKSKRKRGNRRDKCPNVGELEDICKKQKEERKQ